MVGVVRGQPVYLRDVADKIVDGAADPCQLCGLRHDELGVHRRHASTLR